MDRKTIQIEAEFHKKLKVQSAKELRPIPAILEEAFDLYQDKKKKQH